MPRFTDSLTTIAAAAALLPRDSAILAALTDEELLTIPRLFADITRQLEPSAAAIAGEIARRSARELGFSGLAQRTGYRTPELLLQRLTGSTSREAVKLVRTGVIIHEADLVATVEKTGEVPPELTKPWLITVGRAVSAGTLSIEAADAIRTAYFEPVATLLTEGVEDGSLHAQPDPVVTAVATFGAIVISGLSYLVTGQTLDPDRVGQPIVDMVLDGLRPR